jgi:epoxyqueuosine reductase
VAVIDPAELAEFLADARVDQWGVAACPPSPWPYAPALPFAVSIGLRIEPAIIAEVATGPTHAYFAEYQRLNARLAAVADGLVAWLRERGAAAEAVQPTGSPDPEFRLWTDARVFAHKTAATSAGLGWIGKTAIFVSPRLGPKVRLATVFTDAELPVGVPITEGRCGSCRACVDACPVGAGRDVIWTAGMARAELLDVFACERQNDAFAATGGICGICVAVCPFGRGRGAIGSGAG